MHELVGHLLTVFLGFFAIMNPIANTAVFIGLTAGQSPLSKRATARKSLLLAFAIATAFALLGNLIFNLFGITLPALRVTGGVLVFMIGTHMLNGDRSKMHKARGKDMEDNEDSDIAISPLAVPILAGPGTIAATINFSSAGGWSETMITVSMFALLCVVTYFFFISGEKVVKFLGKGGLTIVTRLMGLILAVIGVQMLIEGIYGAVKAYADFAG